MYSVFTLGFRQFGGKVRDTGQQDGLMLAFELLHGLVRAVEMGLSPVFSLALVFFLLLHQVLLDVELSMPVVLGAVDHDQPKYGSRFGTITRASLDLLITDPLHHLQHGVRLYFFDIVFAANSQNAVIETEFRDIHHANQPLFQLFHHRLPSRFRDFKFVSDPDIFPEHSTIVASCPQAVPSDIAIRCSDAIFVLLLSRILLSFLFQLQNLAELRLSTVDEI